MSVIAFPQPRSTNEFVEELKNALDSGQSTSAFVIHTLPDGGFALQLFDVRNTPICSTEMVGILEHVKMEIIINGYG